MTYPDDWDDPRFDRPDGLVDCDTPGCRAKREPETVEELRTAVEHWRDHSLLSGCSHAN